MLAIPVGIFGLTAWPRAAEQSKSDSNDKAAIAKNGEAFIEAFHKGDATSLAGFFVEEGDYTDQTGRHLKGRKAIEQAFKTLFSQNKDLKLHIESLSLDFVTPDVAIEDGTTEVFPADGGPPTKARYTIVHVKKGDKWLLKSVRNSPFNPPSNYPRLRGLEWAIGEWTSQTGDGAGEQLTLAWEENQNFIVATFATTARDVIVARAKQWIGWDPEAKRLRSWIFDGTGGFGEGSWTRDGKKWTVQAKLTLRDGKKATATFIIAPGDGGTMTLQAVDRTTDGNKLPDTKAITLKRVK
jgi:uncharacterized protein (TIGR02246 family)